MKVQTGTAQTESVTDSTTIEVMLSAQQLSALAGGPKLDATQQHKSRVALGAAIAAVLVVAGSVAHQAAKQNPVPSPVVRAPAPPSPPPAPVEAPGPVGEPVLYKNPFDRSEVFEFPPGTTRDEARDAVAKALMERAQGRGSDVLKLRIRKIHHSPKSS